MIAVCAVVLVHCVADYAKYDVCSIGFIVGNGLDIVAHIGVPLFVMLSGALMLNENKELSFRKILHYIMRLLILLAVWSVIYETLIPVISGYKVSIKSYLVGIIMGGYYHLWYLYMIIGLYLITPILRLFVKRDNSKMIRYFIGLGIIFNLSIPILNYLLNYLFDAKDIVIELRNQFGFEFVGGYTIYYLTGWYITNVEIKEKSRKILYIAGAVSLIATILITQLFSIDGVKCEEGFYSNNTISIYLYSIAIFVFVIYCFKKIETGENIISILSKLTFGVYIIHPLILALLGIILKENSGGFEYAIKWCLVTGGSFAATFFISKIPIAKKLIKA